MELRVFVNGKPRDVCGVDENTTAEDVVNVLCESLRLVGYYCLVAFWRKNEIVFSPSESPLNVITRVGEHPKQFQFVLRRTDIHRPQNPTRTRSPIPTSHHHRRTLSNSSQHASFQNAATAYNQLQDPSLRRPEDKEVAAAFAGRTQELDVGYAEELQQLSIVDWSRRLEEARQHQVSLQNERSRLQLDLQRLDNELRQARSKVQSLESEMANELTNLLNAVEGALEERRKIVAGLLVAFEAPQLPASSGTNHVCDEVMI
uniref:Ras association domain containing protein n=1 Tax=Echinococcus granulosus TaxID=6210 RepID=A0A068WC54_ECHGR|nr:ras association domain containing protein [Echinococcus granulosus]